MEVKSITNLILFALAFLPILITWLILANIASGCHKIASELHMLLLNYNHNKGGNNNENESNL